MLGLQPTSTGVCGLASRFCNVPTLRDWVRLFQYFTHDGDGAAATGKIFHLNTEGKSKAVSDYPLRAPIGGIGTKPPHKLIFSMLMANHRVRIESWRFIYYADGSEELYDMQNDPGELRNRADNLVLSKIVAKHWKWLPRFVSPSAVTHRRILTYDKSRNVALWEEKDFKRCDPLNE